MESIRQEKYPQPSKNAIKNRLLWVCENRSQEKYPQPSKNAIKNRLLWVCENRSQEKYPQPSKKAKKLDCYGYVRTENHKNTREDNREKKADKKENASYCNLTYNMARFQLHIPQLS